MLTVSTQNMQRISNLQSSSSSLQRCFRFSSNFLITFSCCFKPTIYLSCLSMQRLIRLSNVSGERLLQFLFWICQEWGRGYMGPFFAAMRGGIAGLIQHSSTRPWDLVRPLECFFGTGMSEATTGTANLRTWERWEGQDWESRILDKDFVWQKRTTCGYLAASRERRTAKTSFGCVHCCQCCGMKSWWKAGSTALGMFGV